MANGNISISNTYDSYGFITQSKQDRANGYSGNIMTLNTVFDEQRGNLTSRTNSLFNWSESFTYDSLDRLTTYKNVAGITETQSYDDRGRITQNAVGTYNYSNSPKPYQNTSVTVTPDALAYYQGNTEQNISYNAFKSPYEIEEVGKDKISFTYNDSNGRSTMFYGSLANDKSLRPLRKYYSADSSMEIKHNSTTGAVEFITYIGGDGYTAPLVLKSDGTTQNYLFLQRDYQGSIVAISDNSGMVLEKRLYDAWGNVLVQDGAGNTLNCLTLLDRGYTGHEHLQSVGLIHMNGRLYDPKLHRFLQPDNYVQDPSNTQNYNRYGYVLNNPLKYTDPSGEISFKSAGRWLDKNWKSVVTVGAAVVTGVVIVASMGTATPLAVAFWAGAGAGFVGGTLGTALNGGNFGESLVAGLTGAAFGAVTGMAGAYMSAAVGAVGIIPGAIAGAANSTALTAFTNLVTGNDWNSGLGMSAIFGAVGGGISGFQAAKDSGAGIWMGTKSKPSISVIATSNQNSGTKFENSPEVRDAIKAQAKATNVEIDMGNQGKHLLDHNNYMDGRSILDANPHTLLENVQSGNIKSLQTINSVKTRIDFGTGIGTFRDINLGGAASQTTKAIMITGKNGVHFVPSRP
ncbi:RHS repeat-associated core domain-containing protein [Flavobacterium faecale]|uniref:RHS repeat-associated core domain-containing protein n=1 Tax=Flavobacterium faecale TaxID=1355330 RepID=UPI003AB08B91